MASVYIRELVSPLVQEMASFDQVSTDQLDALLVGGALRLQVVAIKV